MKKIENSRASIQSQMQIMYIASIPVGERLPEQIFFWYEEQQPSFLGDRSPNCLKHSDNLYRKSEASGTIFETMMRRSK